MGSRLQAAIDCKGFSSKYYNCAIIYKFHFVQIPLGTENGGTLPKMVVNPKW